jgi:hypothetical protein
MDYQERAQVLCTPVRQPRHALARQAPGRRQTRSADKRRLGPLVRFASRQESCHLLDFSLMALWLQLSGLILFLALWGVVWRRQPNLALGIFFGVAIAAVVAALVRPSHVQSVPLWLPPLPFAAVAVSLFGFGIWAWVLGRER